MTAPNPPQRSDESSDDDHREPVSVLEEAGTGTADHPDIAIESSQNLRPLGRIAAVVLCGGLIASLYVFARVEPVWLEQKTT